MLCLLVNLIACINAFCITENIFEPKLLSLAQVIINKYFFYFHFVYIGDIQSLPLSAVKKINV